MRYIECRMDKEQFRNIFDSYFDPIRSFIYYRTSDEMVADDIAQDVFMQLWERRHRLELTNVKSLLYKMASDMVVSHYRKQDVRLDFSRNMHSDDLSISPQEELQFEELSKRYANALQQMTEGVREVFLMSREESMKYQEIAERLGLSVKAVEKRMSQALQLLKSKLIYLLIWIATI